MSGVFLEQHRKGVVTCTHCPRLCRFVCPVSESERRETVTPTALMSVVHLMQTGNLDANWQKAAALFDHCTLCGRCTALCTHDEKPWEVLLDARLELRRGLPPPEWTSDKLRASKSTLSAMLKRLEGKQSKWLLAGRDIVSPHHGNALFDLAESVYQRGILSLDPVLQILLPAVERGYGEAVRSVAPLLAEVIDRADQVFLFDDQTQVLVNRLLVREKSSLGKVRSGWQLFLDLVQKSDPSGKLKSPEALFLPSCGLRSRPRDIQAIFRILAKLGVPVVNSDREDDNSAWIGCCGGGGYPEEEAPRVAEWSLRLAGEGADLLVGDRNGCLQRYAAVHGQQTTTVLDLVARSYNL